MVFLFLVYRSLYWFDLNPFHLIANFQREACLFVQFDVFVSHFGAHVAHDEGLEQHRLILNGRNAFVIVQEQSLYKRKAEWHSELCG